MTRRARTVLSMSVLMFAIYGYFLGAYINNPMTNAEADLAIALVDDHSIQIDRYAGNTSDVSGHDNHIYPGFGPGLGLMLVPIYAAMKPLVALLPSESLRRMDLRLYEGAVVHSPQLRTSPLRTVVALLVVAGTLGLAIPLAIASVLRGAAACRRYVPRLDADGLLVILTLYAFGSLATAFAANLQLTSAAACLVWLAVCEGAVVREGPLPAGGLMALGLLLGLAAIVDYQAILFAAYAGASILWRRAPGDRARSAVTLGLGGLVPYATSMAYHFAAFGSAFTNAYRFRLRATDRNIFDVADVGSNLPSLAKLKIAFLSPVCGIVWYHPLLLLGIAVTAHLVWKPDDPARRPFWILGLVTMLSTVGIYSSYPISVGPGSLPTFAIRYTTYSLPYVVVAVAALWSRLEGRRGLRIALVALMAVNAIPVWMYLFYGVPVSPSRDYGSLLRTIGPASYTLTKLHEGHLIESPVWGWTGFAAVVALFLWWRRPAAAFARDQLAPPA